MVVKGGTARVYAYPNITNKGKKIKDSDINFVWSLDGNINKTSSGYGKNYLDMFAMEISSDKKFTLTIYLTTACLSLMPY